MHVYDISDVSRCTSFNSDLKASWPGNANGTANAESILQDKGMHERISCINEFGGTLHHSCLMSAQATSVLLGRVAYELVRGNGALL